MSDRANNPLNRRRWFPPGTRTRPIKVTVSEAEEVALERKARAADVPVSELLVSTALTPRGKFPMRFAQALGFKMKASKTVEADAELVLRKLLKSDAVPTDMRPEVEKIADRLRDSRHALNDAIEEVMP